MGFYSSGPKIKENDIKVKVIELNLSLRLRNFSNGYLVFR